MARSPAEQPEQNGHRAGPRPIPAWLVPGEGVAPSLARRLLDIVASALALVFLLPVLAVLAVLVRLSSPGPAIYRQARLGQGCRPFTCYKFRTMRSDVAGPEVTSGEDARTTRIGHLLRRTSLDELPQFFNVLRGDMTLVGARPETLALAARYPANCIDVLQHRPGLTGPAQVQMRDWRSLPAQIADVELFYIERLVPRRVVLDREYLNDPTLRRTISVIWHTVAYLFSAGHAALPPAAVAEDGLTPAQEFLPEE